MIDRPRDDKGLFKPSGIKSFTGSRVCRRCNVEKECTHENFRVSNKGTDVECVATICRSCDNESSRKRHEARRNDPDYKERRKASREKHKIKRPETQLFNNYRTVDRLKGWVNDLTKETVKEITGHPCVYCGATDKIGLDRLDNSKPHNRNNVVPACGKCNVIRGDYFTVEEMLNIIGPAVRAVQKFREANKP